MEKKSSQVFFFFFYILYYYYYYYFRIYNKLFVTEICISMLFSDVALVTSLRDGMNLVSYEFVACQASKKGVLILSEVTKTLMCSCNYI